MPDTFFYRLAKNANLLIKYEKKNHIFFVWECCVQNVDKIRVDSQHFTNWSFLMQNIFYNM